MAEIDPAFDTKIDVTIDRLVAGLRPVRRLLSPIKRTGAWVLLLGLGLAVLMPFSDVAGWARRLTETPDLGLAVLGALATSVLAAYGAFATSVPGRSHAWAWLPLPGVLLWVGASGLGCLREIVAPDTVPQTGGHWGECIKFLLLVSLPLGAVMIGLLRRAYMLRPNVTVALGGLACAGGAAVWLSLRHPFDATASDLLGHLAAVGMIIVWVRLAAQYHRRA